MSRVRALILDPTSPEHKTVCEVLEGTSARIVVAGWLEIVGALPLCDRRACTRSMCPVPPRAERAEASEQLWWLPSGATRIHPRTPTALSSVLRRRRSLPRGEAAVNEGLAEVRLPLVLDLFMRGLVLPGTDVIDPVPLGHDHVHRRFDHRGPISDQRYPGCVSASSAMALRSPSKSCRSAVSARRKRRYTKIATGQPPQLSTSSLEFSGTRSLMIGLLTKRAVGQTETGSSPRATGVSGRPGRARCRR
jgi:hypothetical protein